MIRRLLSNIAENALGSSEPVVYSNLLYVKHTSLPILWFTDIAPCFPVQAKNITILTKPEDFYNILIIKCQSAKKRITLASLYLGNGSLEKNFVDSIRNNQYYQKKSLTVNILLDYTRGSRSESNSRTMLLPLVTENNCKVSLYHTPVLHGFLKKFLPDRWNELLGLQHMKLYIFDNTVIISGANLSNDYFTNRQDRYFIIEDKKLSDFYCGLVNKVQDFSLNLDTNNDVKLSENWELLPYESDKNNFINQAANNIKSYLNESLQKYSINDQNCDTWIFPLIQMGQLGIEQDAIVTNKIFANAPYGSKLKISTGYFNLTDQYMATLTECCQASCDILMAHPKANGFLGAKGLAGGIPYAYSLIAKNFKSMYERRNQQDRIKLFEYYKEGWTYHAKGLWYYPPDASTPCLTLIGSPNFGERSVKRDIETQVAILTEDSELQDKLETECSRLYRISSEAETERKVPYWVATFVLFCRSFF